MAPGDLDLRSYGITVPESYRAMSAAGLLSYGASREDWQTSWKTLLVTAPPALAWIDLEWMTPDAVLERASANEGRSPWRDQWKGFPFVAFAQTGAGDEFGWAPSLAEDGAEPPVVYIEHDSDDASIVAPTFSGFVFRKSLEGLAHIPHKRKERSLDDTIASAVASVRRVLPHLEPAQAKALERVLGSPLRQNTAHRCTKVDGVIVRDKRVDLRSYAFGFEMGAYRQARALLKYRRFDETLPYDVTPT